MTRIRNLFAAGILTLSALLVHAQTAPITIDPTHLGIPDGLVSQLVTEAFQDSYGLIWIATNNGLQRYDGNKFETFKTIPGKSTSIHSNVIWDILEDIDHNIWLATDLGASKYNRETNEFKNFTFGGELGIAVSNGRSFNFLLDSQNRLWLANGAVELLEYDRGAEKWKRVRFLNNDQQTSGPGYMSLGLAEDSDQGIWIGSGRSGLMVFAKGDSGFRKVSTPIEFTDSNFITDIYFESSTSMYITSRTGVYKYNPKANTLTTLFVYKTDLADGNNNWNYIVPDHEGNIWITNNFRGMMKFAPNSDKYEHIFMKGSDAAVGAGFNFPLSKLMVDRSGIFWIGSLNEGLFKYDPTNKPFTVFLPNEADQNSVTKNGVFGILASKVRPGIVYIGTRGAGFQIFDSKKQTFQNVGFMSNSNRFANYARSFAEDDDGTLWVGSWQDGLIKFDKNYNEVARYVPSDKPGNISNGQVRVIKHGPKGKLWVGTNFGFNEMDVASGTFKQFTSVTTKQYPKELLDEVARLTNTDQMVGIIDQVSNGQNRTVPIEIKEGGKYLVMTVGEGDVASLADFGSIQNVNNDTVWYPENVKKTYHAGGSGKNRIAADLVDLQPGRYILRYVSDDSHSFNDWNEPMPTLTKLWGIVLIKPTDAAHIEKLQALLDPKQTGLVLTGNNISDIHVGKKYVWIGTIEEGLNRFDPVTNEIKHYRYDAQDENSILSDTPNGLYEEDGETLWIATTEGVCKLDIANDKFTRYTEADGLPTNVISQIVPGDDNELWLATQNGISQMLINESLNRVTFINYNSSDGIGGNNFVPLTSTRAPDGRYYFGGDDGLTTFYKVKSDKTPPAVIISNLSISNRSIQEMKENSPLHGSLLSAKEIDLSFDQNNLSFEFAALHFANPKKNQLAHMLEGYDKDWIYDNRSFAAYTNLDPGIYTLRVRASNAYGTWNEEGTSLKITIRPPWWRTWWAYGAYLGIFGLIAFSGNSAMRRNIKRRERERSREKELKQAKEIEKAYENLKATQAQLVISEKMASLGELTAGIAHEIQNPLNFVNNFSEINRELIEEMKTEISAGNLDDAKSIADTIAENEAKIIYHGKRADGIVKGMLQHSRTSTGQKEPTDINALSDEYLRLAYHGLRAKDKSFNATMKTDFDVTLGKINAIPQDLGRVILNLITNAFYVVAERKAASAPGSYEPTVSVSTKRVGDKVEIKVTDNGKGIPAAIIDKIFQPFFTTKPSGQGTGLGLSLSYEIVTKGHGGELKVDTKEGEGTTFTIIIPAL